jgi:hypothetical protein
MLYNPNWTTEKSPFDASLQELISWLETKDPNETYDYLNDHGIEKPYVGGVTWNDCSDSGDRGDHYIPEPFCDIARGSSAYCRDDWTFGDALARARSYLK